MGIPCTIGVLHSFSGLLLYIPGNVEEIADLAYELSISGMYM